MEPLVRKTSLPRLVADRIRNDVRSGIWEECLPGTRSLAKRYGVSRKTCESALNLLSIEGVLAPPAQGAKRQILSAASEGAPGRRRLLIIQSASVRDAPETLHFNSEIAKSWRDGEGEAVVESMNFLRHRAPESRLGELIHRHHADALLLINAPASWCECAMRRLPTYFSGGDYDLGWPASFGSCRLPAEIAEAACQLRALGHERIVLPLHDETPTMAEAIRRKLRKALGGKPTDFTPEDMCPMFSEDIPEVWKDYWSRLFTRTRPTAVILMQSKHMLSLHSFCHTRGIRVPEDLSVVLLAADPQMAWLSPRPVILRFPYDAAISHIRRWIANGTRPLGEREFHLEVVPGETVGPPPGTRVRTTEAIWGRRKK